MTEAVVNVTSILMASYWLILACPQAFIEVSKTTLTFMLLFAEGKGWVKT